MDVKDHLLNILDSIPEIKYHPKLINDLVDILDNSGKTKTFTAKFFYNLLILSDQKEKAHLSSHNFEKLKSEDNLYSMHIIVKDCNARIIYSFLENGTILLHGFYEREGKSKTDYNNAIKKSKKRITEIKKEE